MNVIQLRRHILRPNCKECRASLIPTLLYMRSDRAVVGRMTSLSHCPVNLSSSSGTDPSQGWSEDSFGSAPARSWRCVTISLITSTWMYMRRSTLSHCALFFQSSGARDSSAGFS